MYDICSECWSLIFPQAHRHLFLTTVSVGSHLGGAKLPGVSIFGEYVPEKAKRPRANTTYMREMTGRMIITHEQLTLLENIGQGVC